MTVCKKFRDGAELHMVVAMSDDRLFQNWYSVIEDDAGIQHPSSTAGYFDMGRRQQMWIRWSGPPIPSAIFRRVATRS